jgi:hypothetical protein
LSVRSLSFVALAALRIIVLQVFELMPPGRAKSQEGMIDVDIRKSDGEANNLSIDSSEENNSGW